MGAPTSVLRRAHLALRRGSGAFMALFRAHLAALAAHRPALTPAARDGVARLQAALAGGFAPRLRALGMPGLRRQTFLETLTFRLWFLLG